MMYARELTEHALWRLLQKKREEGGLGITVSRPGLHAFIARKRREKLLQDAEGLGKFAATVTEKKTGDAMHAGMLSVIRQKMLETALDELTPEGLLKFYDQVEKVQARHEERELEKKKLEENAKISRDRLRLEAAKLALEHADELRELISAGQIGDGDKLEGALRRLFGEKFAKAEVEQKGIGDSTDTQGNGERHDYQ